MEIKKMMVVGCGQMGHGIAQVCAIGGVDVYMCDVSEEIVKKAIEAIKKSVTSLVQKGKIKEDEAKVIERRLIPIKSYGEAKDVNLVIEAAVEDINVKKKIFKELDAMMPEDVILTSCSSALPITEITSGTKKPGRTIGTHFHHPPAIMKLVEVIVGYLTSQGTVETVINFLTKVGKTPVPCKDYPGFVTSRVGIIMINEAINCLAEGVSITEDVDRACVAGFNWPMGPLKLADLIGLDTCLYVLDDLAQKLGPRFLPSPLLRQMVLAGHLGVKTGKGFFDYSKK
jgi:3-hydroxybutyryl-CoA dehydrogenase